MHAVVFAYHDVGVNCLKALLNAGIQVDLVVTHQDDPNENVWFGSVAKLCQEKNISYITPSANELIDLVPKLQALAPDYIFSFYYRFMIPEQILDCAKIAALNMHGSLLPKYRGRAPVNWAILHGETETGATLHFMDAKPDAGDIVGQAAVSIDPDETATDVFAKVSQAAVSVIDQVLPGLLKGTVPRKANELQKGSYFGGRKPADGQIHWNQTAKQVHDLVRAVAPPYPGAFTDHEGKAMIVARTSLNRPFPDKLNLGVCGIQVVDNRVFGICGDHQAVEVLEWFPASK
ncbi:MULTISPECIES: formyltransferase [unclassified Polynucleobacter]|uniref:formyltransferase n=1 Tax=unclassified Polynucleobacter TaxID=2640945 RepID=UPI001BFD85A7|nr:MULTISPECIES: formyltransferase [unclassified Polynucleobacter]MBU3549610.1 formyltransferase [Polynucleobacter sp. P1-05-14]MBU3638660.1 formyltransferase [Polynucleobacter sp. AP-RePozz3-80-G7]QWD82049.1 formyltransferase [Polynucleobacter sp. MWH-S4W17]